MKKQLRYIDLFAGLGGFHVALSRLGHECVFASELNEALCMTYEANFNIRPAGDIKRVKPSEIPAHDILCAGFPCQPFSKAGEQQGLNCPRQGDLFGYAAAILKYHQPKFILLENVPNLLRHDKGGTYQVMKDMLEELGYDVREALFSPHQFGIPQIRERAYIVGCRSRLTNFEWPAKSSNTKTSITWALEKKPVDARKLTPQAIKVIEAWQQFLELFPANGQLPSFPIWAMEFGADYPFEDETPCSAGTRTLTKFHGAFGKPLRDLDPEERLSGLPGYAQTSDKKFPHWKVLFIRQNRELYRANKKWIDKWLPSILSFVPSHQKFEWNCQGEERDIWKYVLQFRASGLRVKRSNTAPSLIAMTTTQVPIIAWERRYMTPRECARLQSLDSLKKLPSASSSAFKALGNAVNAKVVEKIARALIEPDGKHRQEQNGQSQRRRYPLVTVA